MRKIGLCLSGGGARGAYQIGAVQALDDLKIYKNIRTFSGASIGAANVAVLATNTISEAKKIWYSIPDNPLVKPKSIVSKLKEERFKALDSGIYSMEVFEEVLISKIYTDKFKSNEVFVTKIGRASCRERV